MPGFHRVVFLVSDSIADRAATIVERIICRLGKITVSIVIWMVVQVQDIIETGIVDAVSPVAHVSGDPPGDGFDVLVTGIELAGADMVLGGELG